MNSQNRYFAAASFFNIVVIAFYQEGKFMNLKEEANKCLLCKNPRCSKRCPISTPIPE
jgi:NADPH-dependent glutamate synthase beta subunit-like oxidoreductase